MCVRVCILRCSACLQRICDYIMCYSACVLCVRVCELLCLADERVSCGRYHARHCFLVEARQR